MQESECVSTALETYSSAVQLTATADIALNADGSANFAGDVYSGVATKGTDSVGVHLFDTGNIQVHKTAAL